MSGILRLERLPIEIHDIGEGPCREEVVADVANGSLHAPFFVPARWGHRLRQETWKQEQLSKSGFAAEYSCPTTPPAL